MVVDAGAEEGKLATVVDVATRQRTQLALDLELRGGRR